MKYPVRNEQCAQQVSRLIQNKKPPFSVEITQGAPRTIEQNRLQRLWLNEAAEQGDQTAEEYRAYCKLHFGVAIAKENDKFAEAYDRVMRPLPYETKLAMMAEPLDFPVTRVMTTAQKYRYLNQICTHFISLGFLLTDPKSIDENWKVAA